MWKSRRVSIVHGHNVGHVVYVCMYSVCSCFSFFIFSHFSTFVSISIYVSLPVPVPTPVCMHVTHIHIDCGLRLRLTWPIFYFVPFIQQIRHSNPIFYHVDVTSIRPIHCDLNKLPLSKIHTDKIHIYKTMHTQNIHICKVLDYSPPPLPSPIPMPLPLFIYFYHNHHHFHIINHWS